MTAEAQTEVEILKAVRDKLADPKRWSQGMAAKNAKGEPVHSGDVNAVAWCLWGALNVDSGFADSAWHLIEVAAQDLYGKGPIDVNEDLGHEAVMKVLDRAIGWAVPA